ncbi:RDD family protein [Lacticaseibacillus yichunensis]|uniref:RDD family protein n=1 Tax=Lacticaseibacillus yichunensis TaxID=2486015 RepID=A0ABW4CQT9_9LACO|nr:RDD family protein [Lacticaseibacillus yichunensis]
MHTRYTIVRALAGLIDFIVAYVPAVIIFVFGLHTSTRNADLLGQAIFVLYNIVALTGFHGQTVGKYFGHLKVDTAKLASQNVMFVGIREVTKVLFFTPVIGIPLLIVNLAVCLLKGRTIEDYVGQTVVTVVEPREVANETK